MKAAVGREHFDAGRLEGIVGWEVDDAVIDASVIGGVGGTLENVVPFQKVVGVGFGEDVRDRFLQESFIVFI